ncbi:uncharacterized protein K489DRAFT_391284 [Dissoconium aciculare CBS 342.82]|uniref:NB-ARC domain-containing protein n=1 Tax=Dissoconium aciculare CBS 342.82 TaxID=1314786 RepID=A0A6J3LUE9_9PEZI|nr:uncharacterized protein K489DRAFT_391284 [Dissoconium aciculare CBS 342.82]KAF1818247.1 hypothetical protein K489DRAFT_391284 [Dissoconium aciculare CBS 342.82]
MLLVSDSALVARLARALQEVLHSGEPVEQIAQLRRQALRVAHGSTDVEDGLGDADAGVDQPDHRDAFHARHDRESGGDPPATPAKPRLHLPFRRDPHFVERVGLTEQIARRLSAPSGRAALVGLGGVGKSQLAIEHCYRYHDVHADRWVLWIYASSATRFAQSVREIASLGKIRGRDDVNADIYQLLRAWLLDSENGHWLVVLDNADDIDYLVDRSESGRLIDCIPTCPHGAMIVTSRNRRAARRLVEEHDTIDVDRMDEADAMTLVARKLRRITDTAGHRQLVGALEYMPLAITQAAAFLQQSRRKYTIERYMEDLERLDASEGALLDRDHGDLRRDPDASNSIILTWQISFEHIRRTRRSAADLLSLMCLCDRNSVPELLISPQREGESEDAGFEGDLSVLLEFSFIIESSDDSAFEMHRLVQLATRKWSLSRGEMGMHVDRLLVSLDQTMPWVEHAKVSVCEMLFPHARSAMELTAHVSSSLKEWRDVMDKAARYASYKGSGILLHQAIEMGERCWEAKKRQLGEEHRETLVSMGQLARYYDRLGDSRKAAEMGERCWEARKRQLGEEHPHTLVSMSNLAGKAAEMEERCWEAKKRQLGEEHRETLVSMGHLAGYYDRLGDSRKAAEMGERCWEVSKRQRGEDHPHTMIYKNNIARYQNQSTREDLKTRADSNRSVNSMRRDPNGH